MDNNSSQYSNFNTAFEQNMQSKEPSYNQIIIKPPEKIQHINESKRFIIDSQFRDFSLYDNPGKYVYQIPQYYKDVVSAELIEAKIPNSFYNIYNGNNKFFFI